MLIGSLGLRMAGKKKASGPPTPANWNRRTKAGSYTGTFNGAAHYGGAFIVVGDNGEIQRSTDNGMAWAEITSGVSSNLRAVIHDGSKWCAVGAAGARLYSVDGLTWTAGNIGYTAAVIATLAYTGLYYIVGLANGRIYRTTDFTSSAWDQVTSGAGTAQPQSSWANGSTVVHVETDGNVRYSTNDGASWALNGSLGTTIKLGVCFGAGLWVVTGGSGLIRTSANLSSWQSRSAPSSIGNNYLPNVIFINGMFIGISTESLGAYYSYDGITWLESSHVNSSNDLFQPNGLAFNSSTLVAVGANARISTCSLEYP